MNYTNNSARLRLPIDHGKSIAPTPATVLSLEQGKHGLCLRVRKTATAARRKINAFQLMALAALALAAGAGRAQAQLGYDPFAGATSHTEEKWQPYTDASTGGTNRPVSTFINGTSTPASGALFNFAVSSSTDNGQILTSGGNIYDPTGTITLTLASTYPITANTVVFSIKTLGNPLLTAGVLLTPSGRAALAPAFTTSGPGANGATQYAFQFNLSGFGGASNFTIAVPASNTSVSFSSAQLDETTNAYTQSVVPEPSTMVMLALLAGGLALVSVRRRQSA